MAGGRDQGGDEDLWAKIAANDTALGSASTPLEARVDDPELASFVGLVGRYRAAVGLMADLFRQGDVERAAAVDDELVDALFSAIHVEATRLAATYGARSDAISLASRAGTIGLLVAAALVVTAFARRATRRETEWRVGAKFRSLVQNSSDLVTILGRDGSITYVGPSIERLLGHSSADAAGRAYASLVHPDDHERFEHLIDAARRESGPIGAPEVVRMAHADGSWRRFETVAQNLEHDPDVAGLVLTGHDTTQRHILAERLRYQATHDELTGLANRKTFLDRVDTGLAQSGSSAVLFVDLDDFKGINDNLGHVAADRMLAIVARRVRNAIRPADLAARLGGDEFAILLSEVDPRTGPGAAADRLLEAINAPIDIDGAAFRLSASIGIALGRSGGHSADLVSEADLAMYAAKRAGKGRYAVFEPSLLAASRERLDLHRELVGAAGRGELVLHYQPIVALPDGAIESVEALVRWVHPTRGLVPPAAFIPLAEETGLISEIGEWVLREATATASAWRQTRAGRGLSISVNVSAPQLVDAAFADRVAAILQQVDFPAGSLMLELTESVFADPSAALTANLEALRALGVKIAIDDFGTGYSSLAYLSRLPIDILKIDRSFVSGPDGLTTDPALVAAIIQMAVALGLRTVAEGVESEEQRDLLFRLGCQMAQGYVLSRPVPAEAFGALLERGRLGPMVARSVYLAPVETLAS
ncbi:MAG: EAL domain-containing protein [Candidatus Limnocylindrales bacterium]|nr:EAL domain-containing protein [Candidatus Limnocylindrales bacterium]